MQVEFLPCGDTGLTIQFGHGIDRTLSRKILCLKDAIETAKLIGVCDMVPTYRSLLVHYDPLETNQAALIDAIRPIIPNLENASETETRRWIIPACFDEDFAPDLAHVAEWAKKDHKDVIDAILATDHFVYMLGFAPGLPYMGDLPEDLAIPRRENPIPHVEAGSILTATGLTLIYPVSNPTGWHIIGRTPVPIFDVAATDPVLLQPGDHVRFRHADRAEFDEIAQAVAEGSYRFEQEQSKGRG